MFTLNKETIQKVAVAAREKAFKNHDALFGNLKNGEYVAFYIDEEDNMNSVNCAVVYVNAYNQAEDKPKNLVCFKRSQPSVKSMITNMADWLYINNHIKTDLYDDLIYDY